MTASTTTPAQSSNPDRSVPTRRVRFEDRLAEIPTHFAGDGDLLTSHFWALLSATFPEGEDGFVRSVRHYRSQITDPVLRRQVAGFIGQEATHGRQHRALNDRLGELGYPTRLIDRVERRVNALGSRLMSAEMELANTVVAEHFTALLAEMLLRDPAMRATVGDSAVRDVFLWHALEESEHKAVAFDVYRAVGGRESVRIRTMRFTRWILPMVIVGTIVSALFDRRAWRRGELRRSWRRFRAAPFLQPEFLDAVRDFERPDFHPDDRDTDELLHEWRDRLFGPDGTLRDHLGSAA